MMLKQEFVATTVATDTVLVPTGDVGFRGIVRGNKTFAAIVDLLRTDTTEEAVVAALCERYDAPAEVMRSDVSRVLDELRRVGALAE